MRIVVQVLANEISISCTILLLVHFNMDCVMNCNISGICIQVHSDYHPFCIETINTLSCSHSLSLLELLWSSLVHHCPSQEGVY